jgi:hypothetical protein
MLLVNRKGAERQRRKGVVHRAECDPVKMDGGVLRDGPSAVWLNVRHRRWSVRG